jgi:hypothetical protein
MPTLATTTMPAVTATRLATIRTIPTDSTRSVWAGVGQVANSCCEQLTPQPRVPQNEATSGE